MAFNRRIFLYGAGMGVVILLLYGMDQALSRVGGAVPTPKQQSVRPVARTVSVPTAFGYVQVRNFLPAHTATAGTVVVAEDPAYKIVYFLNDTSFLITLLARPLPAARQAAEQRLFTELGIDGREACKLRVSVTIPQEVDATVGGQEYGLSRCPGAKVLPS